MRHHIAGLYPFWWLIKQPTCAGNEDARLAPLCCSRGPSRIAAWSKNIQLCVGGETPCRIVFVQRGGPCQQASTTGDSPAVQQRQGVTQNPCVVVRTIVCAEMSMVLLLWCLCASCHITSARAAPLASQPGHSATQFIVHHPGAARYCTALYIWTLLCLVSVVCVGHMCRYKVLQMRGSHSMQRCAELPVACRNRCDSPRRAATCPDLQEYCRSTLAGSLLACVVVACALSDFPGHSRPFHKGWRCYFNCGSILALV